jgi:hypothetical protein
MVAQKAGNWKLTQLDPARLLEPDDRDLPGEGP